MATLTAYSASSDGYRQESSSSYANARNALGAEAGSATATSGYVGQRLGGSTYYVYQIGLAFDTSAIGSDAVLSAVLSLYPAADFSAQDFAVEARLYDWSAGGYTAADFRPGDDIAGDTLLGTLQTSGIDTSQYWDFSDDALSANINGAGSTYMVLVSDRQRTNNAPVGNEYVQLWLSEKGGDFRPKLVVEYQSGIIGTLNAEVPAPSLTATGTVEDNTNIVGSLVAAVPSPTLIATALVETAAIVQAGTGIRYSQSDLGSFAFESWDVQPLTLEGNITAIGARLRYNAMGACVEGQIVSANDPTWNDPTYKVLRVKLTTAGMQTVYIWSANWENIAGSEDVGGYTLLMTDLTEVNLDARATGTTDMPTVPGVTGGIRVFTSGSSPTIDHTTTIRQALQQRYAANPDAAYGVGADLFFVRGRPSDANYLTLDLDALKLEGARVAVNNMAKPNAATSAAGTPGEPWNIRSINRSSVPLLAKKRHVSSQADPWFSTSRLAYSATRVSGTLSVPTQLPITGTSQALYNKHLWSSWLGGSAGVRGGSYETGNGAEYKALSAMQRYRIETLDLGSGATIWYSFGMWLTSSSSTSLLPVKNLLDDSGAVVGITIDPELDPGHLETFDAKYFRVEEKSNVYNVPFEVPSAAFEELINGSTHYIAFCVYVYSQNAANRTIVTFEEHAFEQQNLADTIETPFEFSLPFRQPRGYAITGVPGIVIPPALITNLPLGESQYVADSTVTFTWATPGRPATVVSDITTSALNYPTQRRAIPRRGREF